MRSRPIITRALIVSATLALAGASGASARTATPTPPTQVTCTLELFAQGPPSPTGGIQFGLVACPRPLGMGVHYSTTMVTPTSPGHGTVAVQFKNFFDRGTRSGTAALTFAATSPTNITYTGTVTYTAGTGKFKHLRGSGTIQCTSTDAGAHKTCTVNSMLTGA